MQTLVSFGSSSLPKPKLCFHHKFKLNRKRTPNFNCKCSLRRTNWAAISLALFGSGFFIGPLIDSLHSRVNLVVYKNGAIDIGPLHTDIWVPPLLGLFYCTVGLLQLLLDEKFPSPEAINPSPEKTAYSFIGLVVFIEVSAEFYKAGVADNIEAYILFAGAELIWLFVDKTRLGFALACFIGLSCPLAEIPFIKLLDLWYYPQANLEVFGQGLVSWTVTCYFVYTTFLINLARSVRSLVSTTNAQQRSDSSRDT